MPREFYKALMDMAQAGIDLKEVEMRAEILALNDSNVQEGK